MGTLDVIRPHYVTDNYLQPLLFPTPFIIINTVRIEPHQSVADEKSVQPLPDCGGFDDVYRCGV
jgi:hypothetical protein